MEEEQSLIWQTAERIFEDLADEPNKAEQLWQTVLENGLTLTWIEEDRGGVGGTCADGYDVIRLAGRYAADVPLVETLLVGRLMAMGGVDAPEAAATIAAGRRDDAVQRSSAGAIEGRLRAVPFAAEARLMLVPLDDAQIAVAPTPGDAATRKPRTNDIGARRADITLNGLQPAHVLEVPAPIEGLSALEVEGVVARAIQSAGALEAVLAMTVQYAKEREAFGRPIAKFQAVQHMIAQIAEEVAAALTVARSAADTLANPPNDADAVLLEVAAAKVRVADAAETASRLAHQVHGAIGFTNEHRLQRYTRALMGWRDDFGMPALWARRLGEAVARHGGHGLWPYLAAR